MSVYEVDYSRQKRKAKDHGRGSGPVVCEKNDDPKKFCRYCSSVSKLYQSDDEDDRNLASRCRARSTFYMNVVDLLDVASGVQVYGCGVENWRDLLDRLPDPDDSNDENVDYISPKSARTVVIKRSGTGLKTKYNISTGSKKLKIKNRWLKETHQLHKILSLLEKDEVELWKPKTGKNRIYILPPWGKQADGDFYREVLYHWNTDDLAEVSGGGSDDSDGYDDWGSGVDDDDVPF